MYLSATLGDDCVAVGRDTFPEIQGDAAQRISDHAARKWTQPLPRNKVCPGGTTCESSGKTARATLVDDASAANDHAPTAGDNTPAPLAVLQEVALAFIQVHLGFGFSSQLH